MSHLPKKVTKKMYLHVSCLRHSGNFLPADFITATSLGSVPYPTATIFKKQFQVTTCFIGLLGCIFLY